MSNIRYLAPEKRMIENRPNAGGRAKVVTEQAPRNDADKKPFWSLLRTQQTNQHLYPFLLEQGMK